MWGWGSNGVSGPDHAELAARRAVITCMSADDPETFTETVATQRGALILAGLGSIEHYVNLKLVSTELTTS